MVMMKPVALVLLVLGPFGASSVRVDVLDVLHEIGELGSLDDDGLNKTENMSIENADSLGNRTAYLEKAADSKYENSTDAHKPAAQATGMSVMSILPLGAAEGCFVKQENQHNCYAGAAQMTAAMCGKKLTQKNCGKTFQECLRTVQISAAPSTFSFSSSFEAIKSELDHSRPVEMSIKYGKGGHALLIVAAAWSQTTKHKAVGIIDPWGRMTVQSQNILFPGEGLEDQPRLGMHWIPFKKVGEKLDKKFAIPSGWEEGGQVQSFTTITAGCEQGFDPLMCPQIG